MLSEAGKHERTCHSGNYGSHLHREFEYNAKRDKTHGNTPASVLRHTADHILSTLKREKNAGKMTVKYRLKYFFRSTFLCSQALINFTALP